MTDLQASLGRSQMKRLDEFVSIRHEISNQYNYLLKDLPLNSKQSIDCYSSNHLYVIRIDSNKNQTRLEIFNDLRNANIGVNVHYIPVYHQ